MPELPEVETIKSDLEKEILGTKIIDVQTYNGYIIKPSSDIFTRSVSDKSVMGFKRIGKVLIFRLENDTAILFHLAMTGRLLLGKASEKKRDKWLRVVFILSGGRDLRFVDRTMYGSIRLGDACVITELSNKYGPDPFSTDLDNLTFYKIIKNKKTTIKNALLDQKLISGVGNIYASEALFIAGIHPEMQANDFSSDQAEVLLKAIRTILGEGIINRGSSIDSYVDVYGNKGFQQNYFRVYGREGQPCIRCGTRIESINVAGRRTYFCPNCQSKVLSNVDQKSLFDKF